MVETMKDHDGGRYSLWVNVFTEMNYQTGVAADCYRYPRACRMF